MPTKLKVGDTVFFGDPPISYFVEDVDYTAKTADIKTTAGPVVTNQNVAWSELILLDESQNAARITREPTKDQFCRFETSDSTQNPVDEFYKKGRQEKSSASDLLDYRQDRSNPQ